MEYATMVISVYFEASARHWLVHLFPWEIVGWCDTFCSRDPVRPSLGFREPVGCTHAVGQPTYAKESQPMNQPIFPPPNTALTATAEACPVFGGVSVKWFPTSGAGFLRA